MYQIMREVKRSFSSQKDIVYAKYSSSLIKIYMKHFSKQTSSYCDKLIFKKPFSCPNLFSHRDKETTQRPETSNGKNLDRDFQRLISKCLQEAAVDISTCLFHKN